MGRADLIGDGDRHLVPATQPDAGRDYRAPRRKNSEQAHQKRTGKQKILTQHTGLPPRDDGGRKPARSTRGKPGGKRK